MCKHCGSVAISTLISLSKPDQPNNSNTRSTNGVSLQWDCLTDQFPTEANLFENSLFSIQLVTILTEMMHFDDS